MLEKFEKYKMRLICPNCDAEYEVDSSAIPDAGRDVQCSNCGHAWFQLPGDADLPADSEDALFDAPDLTDVADATMAPVATPHAAAEPDADMADAPPPVMDTPRRTLDESLLAVLREEAEREADARRNETVQPIETQTDMVLEAAPVAMSEAARRIARLKGLDFESSNPEPARAPTRREMLPDIEEINSTLRPGDVRHDEDDDDDDYGPIRREVKRSGFRSGFLLMLIIAAALGLTYVMAPQIAEQIPGAKPALDQYVISVDAARVWLDGAMKSATSAVRGLSGSEG